MTSSKRKRLTERKPSSSARPLRVRKSYSQTWQRAYEGIQAAEYVRLPPDDLHPREAIFVAQHLPSPHRVAGYVKLRNSICRCWFLHPHQAVTLEEAVACAPGERWKRAAEFAFDWLVRFGHINYGCCQYMSSTSSFVRTVLPGMTSPSSAPTSHSVSPTSSSSAFLLDTSSPDSSEASPTGALLETSPVFASTIQSEQKPTTTLLTKQKTIVVVGAGISGLSCARQLEYLVQEYKHQFLSLDELPPKVVVVEGRDRVGGRVHSLPIEAASQEFVNSDKTNQIADVSSQPAQPTVSHCVDLGGMIVTGFEGNPLDALIRGQLRLPYHALRPETPIFEDDRGKTVEPAIDIAIEKLFNDCLDRVSVYKFPPLKSPSSAASTSFSSPPPSLPNRTFVTAAEMAVSVGLQLRTGISKKATLHLDEAARMPTASLGSVLEEALRQYGRIARLQTRHYRLWNWHAANLEYSNAMPLDLLSLGGWDLDAGNEWEGHHSMMIDGYQQVAEGLLQRPTPLRDCRLRHIVREIHYDKSSSINHLGSDPSTIHSTEGIDDYKGSNPISSENSFTSPTCRVVFQDGSDIQADVVVSTLPLGLLQHDDVTFSPPLPTWKRDAIMRLGFGVLNKVFFVYSYVFWDASLDIFGIARQAEDTSLSPARSIRFPENQQYRSTRGRFFQWFDITKTNGGKPCLMALVAGEAAQTMEAPLPHNNVTEDPSPLEPQNTPCTKALSASPIQRDVDQKSLALEATQLLRNIFGAHVPEPEQVITTSWGSDPFSRGSYSSSGRDMKPEDYDSLAAPVGNLFFAGEHTMMTHPATVHGAYLSGLRVAQEVLDSLLGPLPIPPAPLVTPTQRISRSSSQTSVSLSPLSSTSPLSSSSSPLASLQSPPSSSSSLSSPPSSFTSGSRSSQLTPSSTPECKTPLVSRMTSIQYGRKRTREMTNLELDGLPSTLGNAPSQSILVSTEVTLSSIPPHSYYPSPPPSSASSSPLAVPSSAPPQTRSRANRHGTRGSGRGSMADNDLDCSESSPSTTTTPVPSSSRTSTASVSTPRRRGRKVGSGRTFWVWEAVVPPEIPSSAVDSNSNMTLGEPIADDLASDDILGTALRRTKRRRVNTY